ncbi:HD domain-containing protein [Micropruina sp.]|uniref:HD domain-containing protein n=1 Tax=Micropruina sp. TaxID=2737536 RepID=UPI0039E5A3AF
MTDWSSEVRHLTQMLVVPLMQTQRHNVVPGIERHESVAEHSFHVACTVSQLLRHFPELDGYRALRMALQHDFAESITGDVSVYASARDRSQKASEEAAALRTLTDWSITTGVCIAPLAQYVDHDCREAGFVCAVDKIVPYFLVLAGDGHHARPSLSQYAETRKRARGRITRCFNRLLPIFDEVSELVAARVESEVR